MTSFLALSHDKWVQLLSRLDSSSYREQQALQWIFRHGVSEFLQMTNLSKKFRDELASTLTIQHAEIIEHLKSKNDKTEKLLLRFDDATDIEGVIIPHERRTTLCVSTQAGCAMACSFCATGRIGFRRQLTFGEILDQVFLALRIRPIQNVVFMGMGEPLDNLGELLPAIRILVNPAVFGFSPRRITVSTVGVPEGIRALTEFDVPVRLALSLHSLDPKKRNRLVPANRRWSIDEVVDALKAYVQAKNKKITIEYLLMKDQNDSDRDAGRIVSLSGKIPIKINLLQLNPVQGIPFQPSERIDAFASKLVRGGVTVTIRKSMGKDIQGACGQLATSHFS